MKQYKKLLRKAKKLTKKTVAPVYEKFVVKYENIVDKRKQRAKEKSQDELFHLKFDHFLNEIGIKSNERWVPDTLFMNALSKEPTKEEALQKTCLKVAKDKGLEAKFETAYANALKVKLPEPTKREYPVKRVAKWIGIAAVIVLLLWVIVALLSSSKKVTVINNSPTVSEQPDSSQHQNSWMMVAITTDPKDNAWIENGVAEIAYANKTNKPEDAKAAFSAWIEKVKTNHNTLVAAGRALLPDNLANFDEATISPDGSWANDATIQLVNEIRIAVLGQGKITVENAPANGFNSGIELGKVVRDPKRGITGDRTAIKIVVHGNKHGDKVRWIMSRCGNIVTIEMFFKDTGKTDEHNHKTTPPPPPPKVTPKNPSQDVGANPKVAPYKKDKTGGDSSKGHQVSSSDGATVSNGQQNDTAADAAKAKAAADKAAADAKAAQEKAKKDANATGAGVVSTNDSHTAAVNPF